MTSLYFRQLPLGPMGNFVYLVGDPLTHEAAVVDPSWNVPAILEQARQDGFRVTHVLLTHGHYDHINGVEEIVEKTDAVVCAEQRELEEFIAEGVGGLVIPRSSLKKTHFGDSVSIGRLPVTMIPTPGHTPGSQCFLMKPEASEPVLLTGDTLFVGSIGRVDFPYSSPKKMFHSLQKIKALEEQTVFYPGHDYGGDSNTLAREKKRNLFLLAPSEDEFLRYLRRA